MSDATDEATSDERDVGSRIRRLADNERRALAFIASQPDGLLETHIASALSTHLSLREDESLRIMLRLRSDELIGCRQVGSERRYEATIDGYSLTDGVLKLVRTDAVATPLEMPNSTRAMLTLAEVFLETKGTLYIGMEVSTPEVFPQLTERAGRGYKTVFLMPRKRHVPELKHIPYEECIEKWRRYLRSLPRSQGDSVSLRVTNHAYRPIYTSALSSDMARITLYSYDAGTTRGGQMISASEGSSLYHLVESQFAHALDESVPLFRPMALILALTRRYLLRVIVVVLLVLVAVFGASKGFGAVVFACLTALAADVARGTLLWFAQRDRELFRS